mgnify:CR=1 FL=1
MPMEPQPIDELPRTLGLVSPNLEFDTHVEILEFVEEEDQRGRTMSIKQRRNKKAMKRKQESGQPPAESGKEKWQKKDASSSQIMEPQCLTEDQAPMDEGPSLPIIALADTPDKEPSTRLMADYSTLPDLARPVV